MDDTDATDLEVKTVSIMIFVNLLMRILQDGLVPTLYRPASNYQTRERLDKGCDSRSRVFVNTERKWAYLDKRREFQIQQRSFDKTSVVRQPKGFATFDGTKRAVANADWNLLLLVRAAASAERLGLEPAPGHATLNTSGLDALVAASEVSRSAQQWQPRRSIEHHSVASLSCQPPKTPRQPSVRAEKSGADATLLDSPTQSIKHAVAASSKRKASVPAPEMGPKKRDLRFLPPLQAKPAKNHNADSQILDQQGRTSAGRLESLEIPSLNGQSPAPAGLKPPDSRAPVPVESIHFAQNGLNPQPGEARGQSKGQQQIWSPFTNTMGPAMSLPKYARASDIVKGVTNDARDVQDIFTSHHSTSAVPSGEKSSGELPPLQLRSSALVVPFLHAQAQGPPPPTGDARELQDGGLPCDITNHARPSAPQNEPPAYFFQPPPLLDMSTLPKEAPHCPHSLYNSWQPRPRPPRIILPEQRNPPQVQGTNNKRTVMGPPPLPDQIKSRRLGPSVSDLITSPQPAPRLPQIQPKSFGSAWISHQRHCSLPTPVLPHPGHTSLPPLRSVTLDGNRTQVQMPSSPGPPSSLYLEPPGPRGLSTRSVRPSHPVSRLPPLRPSVPAFPAIATHQEMPRYPEYALPAIGLSRAPMEARSTSIQGREPLLAGISTPYSGSRQVAEIPGARQPPLNSIPQQSSSIPPQRRTPSARMKESGQPGKTKGSYTFKGWIAPM